MITSLFRRGYRLNRRALGASAQLDDTAEDMALWKEVRAMITSGANLRSLIRFGPHVHMLYYEKRKEFKIIPIHRLFDYLNKPLWSLTLNLPSSVFGSA